MTTLRDVAERAGVSIGSVSAVINETAPVSADMRRRVMAAIDELGYAPDGVARSLRLGRTRTIGLVLPDITNPHFTGMARAIGAACDAAGYVLMLCNTADDPEMELRHLRLMRSQRVDGLILTLAGANPAYADAIRNSVRAPAVMVDRTMDGLDFDSVLLDNREASRLVVEYLIRSGHRRIGVLAGRPGISISVDRLDAYRQTLEENGIAFDESLVAMGDFQMDTAYRGTLELLALRPRPTAIFSTSSLTTIGVMRALGDQGFRCPNDISVAAIDDFEWSTAFQPRLTTAVQPIAEIGLKAMECLLGRLSGELTGPPRKIVLRPTLAVRDSCRVIG